MLPFPIRADGRIAGQMVLFGISYGSLLSVAAGYWVDESVAGQGIATRRAGHGLRPRARPDGAAPDRGQHPPRERAIAGPSEHLGFRDEGVRAAYLHIDGGWRDHRTFALTTEDLHGGRSSAGPGPDSS